MIQIIIDLIHEYRILRTDQEFIVFSILSPQGHTLVRMINSIIYLQVQALILTTASICITPEHFISCSALVCGDWAASLYQHVVKNNRAERPENICSF